MSNDSATSVRVVRASEFKTKCLKLMDEIAQGGGEIVITKNGRPVSRLVPYREKPKSLFGIDRGRIEILGDIVEPLDTEWEVGNSWRRAWSKSPLAGRLESVPPALPTSMPIRQTV